MSFVLGVDIDNTLTDSILYWHQWLNRITRSNKAFPIGGDIDYNISVYFEKELQKHGRDGLDFWRSTGLYDYMEMWALPQLMLKDYSTECEIVFISALKGHHHASKYQFLERYCDFKFDFVPTKEKYRVPVNAMIDDRLDVLNHPKAKYQHKIWLKNPYKQEVPLQGNEIVCADWCEIDDYMREIL